MRASLFARTFVAASFLFACGGTSDSDPDYEVVAARRPATSAATEAPAKEAETPSTPAPETTAPGGTAEAGVQVFAGKILASPTVRIGNPGQCRYDVTLKNISVTVSLNASGELAAAVVRDMFNEVAIECPHKPLPSSLHLFNLKAATKTEDGARLEMAGDASNRPRTDLVIDLVPSSASGYQATLHFKRVDIGPPFDWSITARVTLTPSS